MRYVLQKMPGPTPVERFFQDYSVGERYESLARTIDQADINLFAGLTLDLHPAHVDALFAERHYGGRLAHGMLTFSLVTGLAVEYNLRAISYGYDRVRFPGTVRSGDTISVVAEVTELREHRNPRYGMVVKRYTGTRQDGDVVFVCDHLLAVERGPG